MADGTAESVAQELVAAWIKGWRFSGGNEDRKAMIVELTVALRQREAAEREACAKVADDYSWSMTQTAIDLGARGKPHIVADSKADAGMSIALAIRSRGTP